MQQHIARTEPTPAEFLGRARDLRRRHKLPREEALRGAAREWRMNAPAFGRLAQSISVGRKHLAIDEIRLGSSHYRRADWTAVEPGLVVTHVVVEIAAPRTIEVETVNLVQLRSNSLLRCLCRHHHSPSAMSSRSTGGEAQSVCGHG